MQQLMFEGVRSLVWREVPEPEMQGPAEALVRPVVAARCDGDVAFLNYDSRLLKLGTYLHAVDPYFRTRKTNFFQAPFAYGHECVAEVVSVGDAVRDHQKGDLVVVPWAISCGHCGRCRADLTSKCETSATLLSAYGFGGAAGNFGGVVADVLRVPYADAMLVAVPRGVDPLSIASASDNIVDGYRAVAPYLVGTPGAPVLIVGGGAKSIGLYAAGIAVALGASRVDYVDYDPACLEAAEAFGAQAVECRGLERWLRRRSPTLAEGYPITVDASSSVAGLRYALKATAPGGHCTALGFYVWHGTPLPLWHMYMQSVTLHVGVSHARANIPAALELVATNKFDPSLLKPLVADWADAPLALLERATKVILRRARLSVGHE